jgi:hypothetical protein
MVMGDGELWSLSLRKTTDIFKPLLDVKQKETKRKAFMYSDAHNLFNVLFLSLATGFFLSAKTVRSVAAFFDAVGPSVGLLSSFKWASAFDFNQGMKMTYKYSKLVNLVMFT